MAISRSRDRRAEKKVDHNSPDPADRPEQPRPMHRSGPRPLGLHLTLAMMRSGFSLAGLQSWKSGWPAWKTPQAAEMTEKLLQNLVAERLHHGRAAGKTEFSPLLEQAVWTESFQRDAALIAGVAAYRRHPYYRHAPPRQVIWREGGSTVLLHPAPVSGHLPPVLLVPSLINRGYVLDLAPGYSLMDRLAQAGYRVFLLEWGGPGETEQHFGLTDYIAGRLDRAVQAIADLTDQAVVMAGYCMGGLLALAASLRRPEAVRALALLATPWDFHAAGPEHQRLSAALQPVLGGILKQYGCLPVDILQIMFALIEPFAVADKYRAFGRLPQDHPRAGHFVALEDWLNDGISLAAPVAQEVVNGWYCDNLPAQGGWKVAGHVVDPAALHCPAFVAVPSRDRIVPPASALKLAQLIPGALLHRMEAGHIGMTAGRSAEAVLWQPLLRWLGTV
ncbi:Poly-beta-hydroxybutyrate polymerase [Granulibacter bethesdensis]|nr:Poly-beta-hydroxybutyrate polymerase [Granulibacter bethesdensis]